MIMCKKMLVGVILMLGQIACGMNNDIVFNVMQYGDKETCRNCVLVSKQWHRVIHAYKYDDSCYGEWSYYAVIKYRNGGYFSMKQALDTMAKNTCPVGGGLAMRHCPIKLEVIIDQKFDIDEVSRLKEYSPLIKALAIDIDTKSLEEICFEGRVDYNDDEHKVSYTMNAWSNMVALYINGLLTCFPDVRELTVGSITSSKRDLHKFIALEYIDLKLLTKLESLKIVRADNLRMRVISVMTKECPRLKKLSIIDSVFTPVAVGLCPKQKY
jgi:hypothetical protein